VTTDNDLVIRGGLVVDGSGAAPRHADVAVKDGRIVAVGEVAARQGEEIDATGRLVTPGFIDIHTHYDGQVTWEDRTMPSSAHGVTTAVMGNCGVGFAPCRPEDRDRLVNLMVGVEDIPELVMTEGLPWTWQSFPEYLDVVDSRRRDIDVAAQLPHSALRVFVMGERGAAREEATEADLAEMARLSREAMEAGALGFATSRSIFHRDGDGALIPSKDVGEAELHAIASGLKATGHGVIEALIDFDRLEDEFALLRRIAERSGRPLSFSLFQSPRQPTAWRRALDLVRAANTAGARMRAQVLGRPTGLLLGLELSLSPFSYNSAYQAIQHLPLAARVAEMRKPQVRAAILAAAGAEPPNPLISAIYNFREMFLLGDPPNYEPPPETTVAAIAARTGTAPEAVAYDMLLADDGRTVLFSLLANYVDGTLEPVLTMLKDENTLLGLGDGGAHYGMICDAGYPTFMLTYWTRDRKVGERLSIPEVIHALSGAPAEAMSLTDRGIVAPGYKADLNIIDYDRLSLGAPTPVFDLPGGGRRLVQRTEGYDATLVSGVVTYRQGVATGALPGRLVRGKAWKRPA